MEVTKRQIKALQTASGKIFSSDTERRDWLEENYGVRSFKDLDAVKAGELIKKLDKRKPGTHTNTSKGGGCPSSAPSYAGKGKRGQQKHLTEAQAERIRLMEYLLGWDKNRTCGFIYKQINRNKVVNVFKSVEMLMNYEAVKVIVGMEKIGCGKLGLDYETLNKMTNADLRNIADKLTKERNDGR